MLLGQSYNCTIIKRNGGQMVWDSSTLGTRLRLWQSGGPAPGVIVPTPWLHVYVSPGQIFPEHSCTFPFSVTVPAEMPLGRYELCWQMGDNTEWFDGKDHAAIYRQAIEIRAFPRYRGDFDDDGDVDQDDFGGMQRCLSGIGNPQFEPACLEARLDGDTDVDDDDLALFRICISGPGVFLSASCVR